MNRKAPSWAYAALYLACAALVYGGWRLFWFLTDDAYIAFRYVSHSLLGHGYVWNAPPFLPVEGYTSFLWVLLLDLLWRVTGAPPPETANPLALLCTLATLALTLRFALRLRWRARLARLRFPLIAVALVGLATQRPFLTWSSSGLETALFNLLLLAWVYAAVAARLAPRARNLALAALAAAIYLARPDGLLFAAATVGLLLIEACTAAGARATGGPGATRAPGVDLALAALPLLIVPTHLLWRRSFYGAWLPNTFYAKYTGPWPESGWRYGLSFLLEHGHWLALAVLLVIVWREAPAATGRLRTAARALWHAPRTTPQDPQAAPAATLRRTLVWSVLVLHGAYYTFVIGGDHFEYRVYSHWAPLIVLGWLWMVNVLPWRPRAALSLVLAALLLTYPLAASHWALSQSRQTRAETFQMHVRVAPHWPPGIRLYAAAFDRLQAWLIAHMVCIRHQEHKMMHRLSIAAYPSRAAGRAYGPAGNPVLAGLAVGVPGWVLPHVHVLDGWGLNDYVIARSPRIPTPERQMAHDREPPTGYAECFRPNLFLARPGELRHLERERPLTDAEIRACEERWRRWVAVQR